MAPSTHKFTGSNSTGADFTGPNQRIVAEDARKGQTVGMSRTHAGPEVGFWEALAGHPQVRQRDADEASISTGLYRVKAHQKLWSNKGPRTDECLLYLPTPLCTECASSCGPRGRFLWLAKFPNHSARPDLGRDHENKKRNYHNRTVHNSRHGSAGIFDEEVARTQLRAASCRSTKITLNEYRGQRAPPGFPAVLP